MAKLPRDVPGAQIPGQMSYGRQPYQYSSGERALMQSLLQSVGQGQQAYDGPPIGITGVAQMLMNEANRMQPQLEDPNQGWQGPQAQRRSVFDNNYGRFGDRMLQTPIPQETPARNYLQVAADARDSMSPEQRAGFDAMHAAAAQAKGDYGVTNADVKGGYMPLEGPSTRYRNGQWSVSDYGTGANDVTPEQMQAMNQGISNRQQARSDRYQNFLQERKDRASGVGEFDRMLIDALNSGQLSPDMETAMLLRFGADPSGLANARAMAAAYGAQGEQAQQQLDQQSVAMDMNTAPGDLVLSAINQFDTSTPQGRNQALQWLQSRGIGLDSLTELQRQYDPNSRFGTGARSSMPENWNIGNWITRLFFGQESPQETAVRQRRLEALNQLLGGGSPQQIQQQPQQRIDPSWSPGVM